MNVDFTELLLGLLAILLIVAAVIDVRIFTISNGLLNAAVALLAPVYWWSIGLPLWPDAAIRGRGRSRSLRRPRRHILHGDDGRRRRQAAALALWFKPFVTLKILVIMSLAGGILTLIVLFLHARKSADRGRGGDGATRSSVRRGHRNRRALDSRPTLS